MGSSGVWELAKVVSQKFDGKCTIVYDSNAQTEVDVSPSRIVPLPEVPRELTALAQAIHLNEDSRLQTLQEQSTLQFVGSAGLLELSPSASSSSAAHSLLTTPAVQSEWLGMHGPYPASLSAGSRGLIASRNTVG